MATLSSYHLRRSARSFLLVTVATGLMAGGAALACPLGGHDGPRAHLLHELLQRERHHGHHHLAQAQPRPAPTELGAYARDLPAGAAAPTTEERPPLYGNLGTLTWGAVTTNPEAQDYFDQGYRLGWAFNHAEAARAFRAAQALDPDCPMCFWGEAWVLGPHINYPMEADANRRALLALAEARRLAPRAMPVHAAVIEALSKRHSADSDADQAVLAQAYADAMEAAQQRFPREPHLAVLAADALMNLSPWDYWADDGRTPKGATARIVALLEGVLGDRPSEITAMPDHPGAIHLYIHTVEASDRPERAAPHAERLEALMPGAGHLVHMPSHIWYRLGMWRESLDANIRAAAADEALIRRGGTSLLYSEGYYAHNLHFIMASALMGGAGDVAVDAAEKLAGVVSDRAKREVPWTQPIAAAPYVAHARFSEPDEVLALTPPDEGFPFVRAHWHYARGEALVRLGRSAEARAEVAAIEELAHSPDVAELVKAGVPGPDVLAIAARVVEARLAQGTGDHARAAALFTQAAETQDRLPYMEPPFWYYPVHQSLGAALLADGRVQEAESAFREALKRSPNNGWAAAGLLRAAEARGDTAATAEARVLLGTSWFGGDIPAPERL